jgi:hypothetical protein
MIVLCAVTPNPPLSSLSSSSLLESISSSSSSLECFLQPTHQARCRDVGRLIIKR